MTNFHNASFLAAYGTVDQLPASTLSEISFAGRSNVGKSSILNKLMYCKDLAKVSQTPGKTATINFYGIDTAAKQGACHFVDLPGYGFAKVAKSEKGRWSELIEGYFNQQRRFALVCSLIDIRHEASDLDEVMVSFLQEAGLPYCVVLTKADKLSRQQQMKQRSALIKQLGIGADVPVLITSSESGLGVDDLRSLIIQSMQTARA